MLSPQVTVICDKGSGVEMQVKFGSRKNICLTNSWSNSLFLKSVFNLTAHAILVFEFRASLDNINYYLVSKLDRKCAHLQLKSRSRLPFYF